MRLCIFYIQNSSNIIQTNDVDDLLQLCLNVYYAPLSLSSAYLSGQYVVTSSIFAGFINDLPTLIKTNILQFDGDLKLFAKSSVIDTICISSFKIG